MILTVPSSCYRILRARGGSSPGDPRHTQPHQVFSAHAEVVPPRRASPTIGLCILRARGGSSIIGDAISKGWEYSPRTRR